MGGFFPGKKFGGPPVSVDNFCSLLCDTMECYIVTRNHDLGEKEKYSNIEEGWNDRGNAKVMYVSDDDFCGQKFERVIVDIQPDILYLQGLFQRCVLPCLKLSKKYSKRVVLAPRGELCKGAFKKKFKKIPYIIRLRLCGYLSNVVYQSTSEEETLAIENYLGAKPESIFQLANIPSLPSKLSPHIYKKAGEAKLVFISRILWKKNLLKAICYLKEVKGDIIFDIYGPIEDDNYWEECKKNIKELPSNIIVNYKGLLGHDEVHTTFNKYDAFLFPTLSENYGHVIAESLVSGCIPIISDQTPWNDINSAGAGWAIPLNRASDYVVAIQEIVDMNDDTIQNRRNSISNYLEIKLKLSELKKDYLKVFN